MVVRPRAALLILALLAPAGVALAAPAGGEVVRPVPGALLFARAGMERRDLYVQEVFEFTVSVYSRGVTMGREIALRNEETPGLTFFPYVDLGARREVVDGKAFDVRRFLGRGQAVATGSAALRPVVRASVVVPRAGGAEVRETEIRPEALPVAVRPLPEAGKPEGFGGAVGSFTFAASARPAAVAAGEPVTLTMEIEGRGNVESLAAPQVPAGGQFTLYEPKAVRKAIGEDRTRGRVVFEQVVVPRSAAATSLPAVALVYFDPERKAYQRLVAGPFPLKVSPAARAGAVVVDAGPSAAGATRHPLGAGIAPLKPEPSRWPSGPVRPWYGSFWLLLLQLVPPAAVVALLFAVRRRDELARDEAKARRRVAPAAARTRLGAAGQALRQGDPARFHEAVWEALAAYFGNRLNLLPGQVTGEVVAGRLARAGLGAADVARLGEIFLLLEQARFGRPSPAGGFAAAERDRLAGLLAELERLLQSCEELPQ